MSRATAFELKQEMEKLLFSLRDTIRQQLAEQAAAYGDPIRYLLNVATSNRSQWSGGPYTSTNIYEHLHREIALQLMEREAVRLHEDRR